MDLNSGIVDGWKAEYERRHAQFQFWEKWGFAITLLVAFPCGLAANWVAEATGMSILTQIVVFVPAGWAIAALSQWRKRWLAERTNNCLRAWKQTYAAFDREGL